MTTFLAVLGGFAAYAIIGRFTWYLVIALDAADGSPPDYLSPDYRLGKRASHLAWPVFLFVGIYGVFDVGSRLDRGAERDS